MSDLIDLANPADLVDAVLDHINAEVQRTFPPGPLQDTLAGTLTRAKAALATRQAHNLLSIYLPVTFAVGGSGSAGSEGGAPDGTGDDDGTRWTTALGAAAACTALYLAGRILDDHIDGHEAAVHVGDRGGAEIVSATALSAAVPGAIVGRLSLGPAPTRHMIQLLSEGTARVADGQLGDIASFGRIVGPDDVLRFAAGKTGWTAGLAAQLGALCADMNHATVEAAGRFGVAWGVARQILADCQWLSGRDQRPRHNIACGYPIAVHHSMCDSEERARFEKLYHGFIVGDEALSTITSEVSSSGALLQSRLKAELYGAEALALLATLPVTGQAVQLVEHMVRDSLGRVSTT